MKLPKRPTPTSTTPVPVAQGELLLRNPEQPTVGELVWWYGRAYLSDPQLNHYTARGYRSTLAMFLEHFGADSALPTMGAARDWLFRRLQRREVTALTANSHRDRMHSVFVLAHKQLCGTLLNPFSFRRFRDESTGARPKGLEQDGGDGGDGWEVFEKVLEAMPDDRARAMLCLEFFDGWRTAEPLGLEWRHVKWNAAGGPEVVLEQQRDAWKSVPRRLKHHALGRTYKLDEFTARYLRAAQRAEREGKQQWGCARGALAGTKPCSDGLVRHFVFPYREEHLSELARRMQVTAPAVFPPGKRGVTGARVFYRLRTHFANTVVRAVGIEEARKMLRHKYISSTQLYANQVLTEPVNAEALAKVHAALTRRKPEEKAVSASVENADTVKSGGE